MTCVPAPPQQRPVPAAGSASPRSGSAHAKGILVGEHAAVYGHPAIALPIRPLRTVAQLNHVPGPLSVRIDRTRVPITELPDRLASIGVAATSALDHVGLAHDGVELTLDSTIPARAGLGASAAAAHAVVEAVHSATGTPLDDATRFALVQGAERVAHGNPSGLDARATRASTPLVFEQGRVEPLTLATAMWFVVADSGVRAATHDVVADVGRFVTAYPGRAGELLDRLGELARRARGDLVEGRVSELGARLTAAQVALEALGVGHAATERLVGAALTAGSPGAKLTGAGRGGCVIAAATDAEHAHVLRTSLLNAGAAAGWVVGLDAT